MTEIIGAEVIARARKSAMATTMDGGPLSAWMQHCIPQPAAQGQPAWEFTGAGELSTDEDAAQRLESIGPPTATDNGSSNACSATT